MLLVAMLLLAVNLFTAGVNIRPFVFMLGGLMVAVIAFTSIELSLYLLILSTLLSPEIVFGGPTAAEIAMGKATVTQSRGVTLRLDDMLLTIISISWLFRMALNKELGLIRSTPLNGPIAWYWVATLIATLIGMFAGRVGTMGLFFVIKYLEYFVLFYVVVNQTHDGASVRRYLAVILFTCLIASLIGIGQIPSGERVSAPFEGEQGEPNTFGGYLVLMFSLCMGLLLHSEKGRARLILQALMAIVLVPLAFTESRSSYLALIVSFGLLVWYADRKRTLLLVTLAGMALVPFILPQNVVNRVLYTFTQAEEAGQLQLGEVRIDTSTTERLRSWQNVAINEFPNHPLFGHGVTGGPFMDAQYPRVLAETGVLGLLLFFWLLHRIWTILRSAFDDLVDPWLRGAALGTLCGYGGLLVHAVGANSFIIVRIMEPLMILVGLLLAAAIAQKNAEVATPDR